MKNLLLIAAIAIVLASCSKSVDKPASSVTTESVDHGEQKCDFGLSRFNLSKRAPVYNEATLRKPTKLTTGGSGTTNNTPTGGVIFLDFDGHLVKNTSWNVNGDINCVPANLTIDQITEIVMRI